MARRDAAGTDKAADIEDALARSPLSGARLLQIKVAAPGEGSTAHGLQRAYVGAFLVASEANGIFVARAPNKAADPKKRLDFTTSAPAGTTITVLVF